MTSDVVLAGLAVIEGNSGGFKPADGVELVRERMVSKVKHVSFAIIRNLSSLNQHGIIMTPRQIVALFGGIETDPIGSFKYVQIAQNIYRVIVGELPEDAEFIGVSKCQVGDCSDAIIQLNTKALMQIYPFELKERFPAKRVIIEVNAEGRAIIEFEALKKLVQSYITGDFLRSGQHFELTQFLKTYSFIAKEVVQRGPEAQRDSRERVDVLNVEDCSLGYVDSETEFEFWKVAGSKVDVVSSVVKAAEGWNYTFNLKAVRHSTHQDQLSKVIDLAEVEECIIKTKYWIRGSEMELVINSLPVLVNLTKVKSKSDQSVPADTDLYSTCFEVDGDTSMAVVVSSSLLAMDSAIDAKGAAGITFKIVGFKPEKGGLFPPIIDTEGLMKEIMKGESFFHNLVIGEGIEFYHLGDRYNLEAVSALDKEGISYKKERGVNSRWKIEPDCKIEFVQGGVSVALVESSKSRKLKKINLEMINVELPLGSELNASEDKVKQIIAEQIPPIVVSKAIFNVSFIQAGQQIRLFFKVSSFEEDSVEMEPFVYQRSGKFFPDTTIEIDSTKLLPEKGFEIIKGDSHLGGVADLGVPDFHSLGIGGLPQAVVDALHLIKLRKSEGIRREREKRGIKTPKGVLFYGPPGTGKTSIARQLSKILGYAEEHVHYYNGPAFYNKWLGQTEAEIRKIFLVAEDGKKHVLVIDEIDALVPDRAHLEGSQACMSAIVAQLLACMDGCTTNDNILVLGITNRPQAMDKAILRPGRFDVLIEVSLPDEEGRKKIFEIYTAMLKKEELLAPDIDLEHLAKVSEGFSGADIEGIVMQASTFSLQRLYTLSEEEHATSPLRIVTQEDFEAAFEGQEGGGKSKIRRIGSGGF